MTLLAPLFLVGLAAISLPILFHLIRRTSREKVPFSSLMFLSPSPPRMTRKSRLENILLLLLRCSVLALLAFAFARPFFRSPSAAEPPAAKRTVLLIDSSASMRREGLWTEAKTKASDFAKKAGLGDEVALVLFDRGIRTLISFADWKKAAPGERPGMVTQRLNALQPSWASTQIGQALVSATELLDQDTSGSLPRQIVIISDTQEGARLDGLQGFIWPKNTSVIPVQVKAKRVTNAGLQIMPDPPTSITPSEAIKMRVSNSSESKQEQFSVQWSTGLTAETTGRGGQTNALLAQSRAASNAQVSVYVPPGQSRTIDAPKPPGAARAILTGDEVEFDNSAWVVPPRREEVHVVFIGNDAEQDPQRSLFYLQRAFSETARESVRVTAVRSGEPLSALSNAALVVVSEASPDQAAAIVEKVRAGATVFWPLNGIAGEPFAKAAGINIRIEEGGTKGYAMLGEIDFTHPLLAPFSDPRFSDFTKIRFWKHRRVSFEPSAAAKVIAKFDSGDPALAQFTIGKGTLYLLASGWQPAESQLALSSKFVPLLYSMLEMSGAIHARALAFTIGDSVPLDRKTAAPGTADKVTIRKPGGTVVEVPPGQNAFTETDEPGVYQITSAQPPLEFAVNIAAEESKTAPMAMEALQTLGVPLNAAVSETAEHRARTAAALKSAELESRQKLWRWLIAATLMVLMVETIVAARLSRSAPTGAGT